MTFFMNKNHFKTILFVFFLTSRLTFVLAQDKQIERDTLIDSKAFIDWARKHAFPLANSDSSTSDTDLEPLRKMIGNARVVALGAPAHGLHSMLAFRNPGG